MPHPTPSTRPLRTPAYGLPLLLLALLVAPQALAQSALEVFEERGPGLAPARITAPAAPAEATTVSATGLDAPVSQRLTAGRSAAEGRAAFIVSNVNDSGAGSLRQAILDANATPGEDGIGFQIPGTGPHRILPSQPLPAITETVHIDGFSQAGSAQATATTAASIQVVLDGRNAGAAADGLVFYAGGSVISGLSIVGFGDVGIGVYGSEADGNSIVGNYIGVEPDGTTRRGNLIGVQLSRAGSSGEGPRETLVGAHLGPEYANVIAGNGDGVQVLYSPETVVSGNLIGTNVIGGTPVSHLGNTGNGVAVAFGASDNVIIANNAIAFNGTGVLVANETQNVSLIGNAIGGNGTYGVDVNQLPNSGAAPEEATLVGNSIGINPLNGQLMPNGIAGVRLIDARNSRVGAATSDPAADRNVISANGLAGVVVTGTGSWENRIQNNYIGTDAAGTAAAGNGCYGVFVANGATYTRIGKEEQEIGGNVISGNTASSPVSACGDYAAGVYVFDANNTVVWGNQIGVGATGGALGNTGYGILAEDSEIVYVGYYYNDPVDLSNEVAHNGRAGVRVGLDASDTSHMVGVYENSIHDNGGLGIDLGGAGVSAHAPGSGGPNGLVNHPVLTSATVLQDGTLRVEGTLDVADGRYAVVQFYASPSADPSGHGEGRLYLGGNSGSSYSAGAFSSEIDAAVPDGWVVTATATIGDPYFGTSEFSNAVSVSQDAGRLQLSVLPEGTPRVTPGGEVAVDLTVTDEGGAPVNDVTVTLSVSSGGVYYPDVTFEVDGSLTYFYAVPESASPGTYHLAFTANKPGSGYTGSTTVVRTVEVEVLDLVLTVTPTDPVTLGPGEEQHYALEVTDENGAVVGGATVNVSGLLLPDGAAVTAEDDGTAIFVFTAPERAYGTASLDFQAMKTGYNPSAYESRSVTVEPTLSLDVYPEGPEPLVLAPGESFPYTVYAVDQLNAPVAGAVVEVEDPFLDETVSTTVDQDGRAEYAVAVPEGTAAGDYTLRFTSSAEGHRASAAVTRTVRVPGDAPSLVLTVSESASAAPGGRYSFSVGVTDADGHPVQATVYVDEDFREEHASVTTDAEGVATYEATVPEGTALGDYTAFFVATAEGYYQSEAVERTVTVTDAPAPLEVQLVHNSAGLALAGPIDVSLGTPPELVVSGFSFGQQTDFIRVTGDATVPVTVSAGGQSVTLHVPFPAAGRYRVTLQGAFGDVLALMNNPYDRDLQMRVVAVQLVGDDGAIPSARTPSGQQSVMAYAVHGVTDAPVFDVVSTTAGVTVAAGLDYGETSPMVALDPTVHRFEVRVAATGALINVFELDLSGASGESFQISAGGFLEPTQNGGGPGITLFGTGETLATSGEGLPEQPSGLTLEPVYPNPFHTTAKLRYSLPSAGPVRVSLYDALGRRVRVLMDREVPAGWQEVSLDRHGLGAGVYLVQVEAGGLRRTRRLTLAD